MFNALHLYLMNMHQLINTFLYTSNLANSIPAVGAVLLSALSSTATTAFSPLTTASSELLSQNKLNHALYKTCTYAPYYEGKPKITVTSVTSVTLPLSPLPRLIQKCYSHCKLQQTVTNC